GVPGLFYLSDITDEKHYEIAAIDALSWLVDKTYVEGEGVFRSTYDLNSREPESDVYGVDGSPLGLEGRPLAEDAVFYRAYQKTGNDKFLNVFLEVCDRLLKDEDPPGNWIMYPPCVKEKGTIHPRHAYWWGLPLLYAYEHTGAKKYLNCALRAGEWYRNAQRRDGGIFRGTYRDFSTKSFGHSTSGLCCAMLLWMELQKHTSDVSFEEEIELGMDFCEKAQFVDCEDGNLSGCILEKVLPPDGTDQSPYHIRDLGTIFYIQALSTYLQSH
ncbi:hypothetical protein AKJ51_04910, partial [candidate division MSBL1 archaeon SCGC-AAA382A20]